MTALIVETGDIVDLVESVECALRPRSSHARHDGHRPVALTGERTHHGLASLRHQPHTGLLVAHLGAGKQADMREPRLAAERRRFDERRDHATPGVANIGIEVCAARGKCFDERGAIPAHGAARLEEDEEDVGALYEPEVGTHGRRGGESAQPRATDLIGEHGPPAARRRLSPVSRRAGHRAPGAKTLGDAQDEDCARYDRQHVPDARVFRRIRNAAERPPERQVDDQRY